jgi:hypothetical protein
MDIKRTKHNFWFLHCCFLRQVVHPSSVRRRLLVTTLPLGSLLVGLSQGNCKTSDLLSHIENICWVYWEH